MSKYTDTAMERRSVMTPDGRPAYNCCQAVVTVFARDLGYDEESARKCATFFRGGMQMGSVCGAVTGGLMALGLAGVTDRGITEEYFSKLRGCHDGTLNCAELLAANAQRGCEKKPFCNALIRECVEYVEEALRAQGKLPDENGG